MMIGPLRARGAPRRVLLRSFWRRYVSAPGPLCIPNPGQCLYQICGRKLCVAPPFSRPGSSGSPGSCHQLNAVSCSAVRSRDLLRTLTSAPTFSQAPLCPESVPHWSGLICASSYRMFAAVPGGLMLVSYSRSVRSLHAGILT